MNPFEDIEKKLASAKKKPPVESDERILADMRADFDRASKVAPVIYNVSAFYKIAAAVIIAAVILVAVLCINGRDSTEPEKTIVEETVVPIETPAAVNVPEDIVHPIETVAVEPQEDKEQLQRARVEQIMTLAKTEDVNGLLAALDDTNMPIQMIIAHYLGQFGDGHAADILVDLGHEHFPDDPNNFFELTANKIYDRLDKLQLADANLITTDANEPNDSNLPGM